MKDYLVVRNEKQQTLEVLEFESVDLAKAEKERRRSAGHQGELVLAFAKDLKSLFQTYTEYRPENWRELIGEKKTET